VHWKGHDDEWIANDFHILKQEERMHRIGRNTWSSFERVDEYLAQHPFADAPAALGLQAAELKEVLAQLSSDAVNQDAGDRFFRAHAKSQHALRSTLYAEHLQPISRVARDVFGATGMDKAFRMPKTAKVNQKLIAAAGAMAEAAEKSKDLFLKHGLPQDFIEQLKASAASLGVARIAKTESNRRRVTATAALNEQFKRGRKAVRLLNAILQPRLAKDPELLAAWRSAKRVGPTTASGASETITPEASAMKVA
jgi:hypothetical protein